VDVSEDKRALMRLKEEAEKCKIALSEQEEYHLLIPFFADVEGNPVSLEETVSRETFEGLIKELIDSTAKQINTALSDARISAHDLDLVLLVGGSTRIPYVQRFIENTLGKSPQSLVDPDLAVVRGAAVQAGILNDQFSAEKDIIITDVCPYTLGISVLDYVGGFPVTDAYDVVIPRNVTIPVVKEKIYGTVADNQTQVEIKVYQGEFKKASYNNFLGKFLLKGIPPAPAFQEKISVSFSYDVNGILQVEGKILSSGKKANLTIETTGVEMVKEIDTIGWEKAPNARKYKAIISKASRMVENGEAGYYALEMESLIRKIKTGLVQGEKSETLDVLKEELHEIIYELAEETDV
jgi:molecular chaperone DnaK